MKITFPDGSVKDIPNGTSVLDIAKGISEGLARVIVGAKVNGKLVDVTSPVTEDATLFLLKAETPEGLEIVRHSCAHLLAQAVTQLYPSARVTIGPVVENGFYYDIDHDPWTPEDLVKIEEKMRELAKKAQDIQRKELSKKEALTIFRDNPYKQEIISVIPENETVTTYQQGEFLDLCRGPHVPNTKLIQNFKLTKLAGAYWRGDEKNKMLQRIYGVAFAKKEELEAFIKLHEEAEKRDHKKLGPQLGIFTFSPHVGSGLPMLKPNGMILRREIEEYLWELHKNKGYLRVWTPHLAKLSLYEQSGHLAHYKDSIFYVEGAQSKEKFCMKPMNCPHHMQIFADNQFSYRDMPIRYFEPATVYRDEKTGQLAGLTRVRAISQDDGHLFCRVSQIKDEVSTIVSIIKTFYTTMGMLEGYWVSLSVRGSDKSQYLGSDEAWNAAETALDEAAKKNNLNYKRVEGEAAFYGPKLDFMFKDAIGREWQLATIQCDFNMPENFQLSFINEAGNKERPVVIHRAISGSLERFLGVMIEHFAGRFPTWLNPVQVIVCPVADRHIDYAETLANMMRELGIRCEIDADAATIPKKVRNAQLRQINYILVVGDQEVTNKTVNVRTRDNVVHGEKPAAQFASEVVKEIRERKL